MKTDWRNKLKTVLAETATAEKSEMCLETQLTKADETAPHKVSSAFVSAELTDISKTKALTVETGTNGKTEICLETALTKTAKTAFGDVSSAFVSGQFGHISENADSISEQKITPEAQNEPRICPACGSDLQCEITAAIFVRFCAFGCSSLYCAFNDWKAARALAGEMLDAASFDECEAMTNALDERTAILMLENDWDFETATRRAESDLIPAWLNEYQTARKFK